MYGNSLLYSLSVTSITYRVYIIHFPPQIIPLVDYFHTTSTYLLANPPQLLLLFMSSETSSQIPYILRALLLLLAGNHGPHLT